MKSKAKIFLAWFSLFFLPSFVPSVWGKPAVMTEPSVSTQQLISVKTTTSPQLIAKESVVSTAPVVPVAEVPVKTENVEKEKKLVGYDKGFYIKSADDKYKLVISGYAQFHFEYLRESGENDATFRVRRARLSFAGNIASKKLTYKLQLDFVKFRDELLLDAFMNYKFFDELEIRFGQFTIPYIRQHLISSSAQEFVDRSLASVEFINGQDVDSDKDGIPDKLTKNGRDIGLMVHGQALQKKLEYQGGIFNGDGTNTINASTDFLYAGRVAYNVLGEYGYEEGDYERSETPAVFIGGSGNYNRRDLSKDKVTQFGAETGLKYKGLAAQGEFFFRNLRPGELPDDISLTHQNDYGYYAQVGYFAVPKKLEVAARASQVFFEGLQNDKAEFMLGVNGFLIGKTLKLQSDYSVLPTNTKEGIETAQRFRLRMQTKF